MLTALSIEHKRLVHLSVISLTAFIHLIYHENDKTFTSWWEGFFPLIEGKEFSFDLILSETTKASRVLSCSFSAFGLHDLEQRSLKEVHVKYHRNHTLLTY